MELEKNHPRYVHPDSGELFYVLSYTLILAVKLLINILQSV